MAISDYSLLTSISDADSITVANTSRAFQVPFSQLRELLQDGMLTKNQGVRNTGKVLMVGADGLVRPTEYEEA